jgi:hypothetical protein
VGDLTRWSAFNGLVFHLKSSTPWAEPYPDVVDTCPTGDGTVALLGPDPDVETMHDYDPAGCRCIPARADGMQACARRGAAVTRHSQGFTKVPLHIPRFAFLASFSAAT